MVRRSPSRIISGALLAAVGYATSGPLLQAFVGTRPATGAPAVALQAQISDADLAKLKTVQSQLASNLLELNTLLGKVQGSGPPGYAPPAPPSLGGGYAPPAYASRAASPPPTPSGGGGGGQYHVSDADIEQFYQETISGSGGDPKKGTVLSELIVKFFHGEFTPQGFKRYSGLWKGPPPGSIGKKDIEIGVAGLKAQLKNPMFVTKGGVGYGVDETQKVVDDGKGWVWLAAEMSPGGLALELFKSVPYGKRALLVAKQNDVDTMFAKINWDKALQRITKTFAGPEVKQR